MKKKNGFISITMIYSFFIVFLTLILSIVNGYVNNRNLLNNLKNTIVTDIADTNFTSYLINHADEIGLLKYDGVYRYIGNNPNNYVCLIESCEEKDMYRIIGIENGKIKIIKNETSEKEIDTTDTNVYINTSIYNYLNNEYLNSLSDEEKKLITLFNWYTGGVDIKYLTDNPLDFYQYEIGTNKNIGVSIKAYIGLPFVSDYIFASRNYEKKYTKEDNWLYLNNMWFITRVSNYYNYQYYLNDDGNVNLGLVSEIKRIRPVMYLKGNVINKDIKADGSLDAPFIIGG